MTLTKSFAACCVAFLLSGCLKVPVAVSDYCFVARRVTLYDMCPEGVAPKLTEDGWGTCSLVTKADGQRLAAEARKYDERCPPAKVREEL